MNSQPGAPSNFFNAGSSSSVPDRSPEGKSTQLEY